MIFQYKKFPDGSWTVIAPIIAAKLNQGDRISVTTRAGKEKTETVTALLCTLADGRHVYRIEQKAKADAKTADTGLLYAARTALEYIDAWMTERKYPDTADQWCARYNEKTPDVVYAQRDRVRAVIAKAEGVAP